MKGPEKNTIKESPEATVLLRYIKEEATAEEKKTVAEWLAQDNSHEKELLQIARIYFAQETKNRILSRNPATAYEKVSRRIAQKRRIVWIKRASTVAACVAAIIISSAFITYSLMKEEQTPPQMITITSNTGMRTQFDLPDGTIVHLNSGSTFSYPVPYDKDERKVSLTGEAYFKVTKSENQPFIVSVNNDKFKVRVLGTEFNLQAYENDNEINTTLVSGSVVLEYENNKGDVRKQSLSPSEKAIYNPASDKINTMVIDYYDDGSDLTPDKEEHLNIKKVNTQYETAWIEGKLMFSDTPLPEVLKRLSHYYNVSFRVNDPVLKTYSFTGTLANRELSQVLDYLKLSSNIDYLIHPVKEDDSEGKKTTTIELWKK